MFEIVCVSHYHYVWGWKCSGAKVTKGKREKRSQCLYLQQHAWAVSVLKACNKASQHSCQEYLLLQAASIIRYQNTARESSLSVLWYFITEVSCGGTFVLPNWFSCGRILIYKNVYIKKWGRTCPH